MLITRTVTICNGLPHCVAVADSVRTFKSRLDNFFCFINRLYLTVKQI